MRQNQPANALSERQRIRQVNTLLGELLESRTTSGDAVVGYGEAMGSTRSDNEHDLRPFNLLFSNQIWMKRPKDFPRTNALGSKVPSVNSAG